MTKSYPTFSVIIPNHNNGETLARAIDSILCQTYPAHEIIVIDDGSTDTSKEVVMKFGDQVCYVYQANAGVSAARNHGARIANGSWLAFLDADDCFLPTRLQTHADWIEKEPNIDFLLGNQEFRTPDGNLMHLAMENCLAGRDLIERNPGATEIPLYKTDFEDLIADGFAEIRTLSLPRNKFLDLGGFPVGKKIGEDLHLIIRLCAASNSAGVIRSPLAIYYIYPNSALRKNILNSQLGFVETLESLKNESKTFPQSVKRGYKEKLRRARLSLGYAYLRDNRKMRAIKSIFPLVKSNPSRQSIRDLLSILKGMPSDSI
jgi:glycosyltransferase involved in cell wall biosynthesis